MRKIMCILLVLLLLLNLIVTYAMDDSVLTRLDAVELIQQLLPAKNSGYVFDDTDNAAVAYYRQKGIIQGAEDNAFMPESPMKTQDFLIMLKRALDVVRPDLFYNSADIFWHFDQNEISPYAQSQLAFLSSVGVYNNSGYIKPQSTISRGMAQYYINLAIYARDNLSGINDTIGYSKKPHVLVYHVIDEPREPNAYLYVFPSKFEEQIRYLYENGYTFLFPEEISLADRFEKPIIVTFDDGYRQTGTYALNILKKYQAKATLYMYTDAIDTPEYCSSTQLRQMSDSGIFRIYSHTCTHADLSTLTPQSIEKEFAQSNDIIYNITKREVTSVAYPFGFFNADVLKQAKRYYKNAFTVNKGNNTLYQLKRLTIDNQTDMQHFVKMVEY
ncbi:MAG: polysaccharide deacetylase family protein [Ruminococcaceae bacterium]|nr:polysaccharide deacetylase family protein [Oscillospiraceae bacterium]